MSIEKKYTEEEIKAIVDEEWSKLKASRELSLDELKDVSGGDVLRDGTGQRMLFDGSPYSEAPNKVDEHIELALAIEKAYGPDVAEIAFGKFGYEFSWGEIRHNGYRCVQRRVKGEGWIKGY
jgi:hypothetical protein